MTIFPRLMVPALLGLMLLSLAPAALSDAGVTPLHAAGRNATPAVVAALLDADAGPERAGFIRPARARLCEGECGDKGGAAAYWRLIDATEF